MSRKLVPHHSHWGAFNAVVKDGKVVGAVPLDFDPDPSPLIDGIADAVHSPTRIPRPMVRAGWLESRRTSGEGRGASRLSQGPSSATALVEVERCTMPPPVRAFAPVPVAADG